jgi:hypothetical protein
MGACTRRARERVNESNERVERRWLLRCFFIHTHKPKKQRLLVEFTKLILFY